MPACGSRRRTGAKSVYPQRDQRERLAEGNGIVFPAVDGRSSGREQSARSHRGVGFVSHRPSYVWDGAGAVSGGGGGVVGGRPGVIKTLRGSAAAMLFALHQENSDAVLSGTGT